MSQTCIWGNGNAVRESTLVTTWPEIWFGILRSCMKYRVNRVLRLRRHFSRNSINAKHALSKMPWRKKKLGNHDNAKSKYRVISSFIIYEIHLLCIAWIHVRQITNSFYPTSLLTSQSKKLLAPWWAPTCLLRITEDKISTVTSAHDAGLLCWFIRMHKFLRFACNLPDLIELWWASGEFNLPCKKTESVSASGQETWMMDS